MLQGFSAYYNYTWGGMWGEEEGNNSKGIKISYCLTKIWSEALFIAPKLWFWETFIRQIF